MTKEQNEKEVKKILDEIERKQKLDKFVSFITFPIWVIVIFWIIVFIICMVTHPLVTLFFLAITLPFLYIIGLMIPIHYVVFVLMIIVFFEFVPNKVLSYFKKADKENIKAETVVETKKYTRDIDYEIKMAERRFDEFLIEGKYIPIEKFKSNIYKIVKDTYNIKIVFIYVDGEDIEPLMIKDSTSEQEVNDYIDNACKIKNIKYAHVDVHEESFLHTVTLTESNTP